MNTNLNTINFRDVGEFTNYLAKKKIMHENRIYRGGKIDDIASPSQMGNPRTIINLRNSSDPVDKFPDIKFIQHPISDRIEKYNTNSPDVRIWLNKIMVTLADTKLEFPVYIHCRSGKDRTGIVIAALLFLLKIPESIIKEEYLLSQGETSIEQLEISLQGINSKKNYFNRVSLENLKRNFLAINK